MRSQLGSSAGPGGRSLLRELPLLLVVALVIAIVIKTFVVQAFVIPTGSMQDTLDLGDKILASKIVYHFRAIEPGDIVVFDGTGSWNPARPPQVCPRHPLAETGRGARPGTAGGGCPVKV